MNFELDGCMVSAESKAINQQKIPGDEYLLYVSFIVINSLTTKKADDKIFVRKFSKNVKSKLYYIENSKTRGQTLRSTFFLPYLTQ